MLTETDVAVERLEEPIPPEVGHELPTRPNSQRGKALMAELRPELGSVSNKDYTFRDPNLAYALACSLQTPGDKEVLDQLLTPELRMKTFQGLVNVSFILNILIVILVSTIFFVFMPRLPL